MTPEQQWLEIQVRLFAGEATESPLRGVLEVRDRETDEPVRYRVRKDRHRWRVETEAGEIVSIQNDLHRFHVHGDHASRRERSETIYDGVAHAVARPDLRDQSAGDFTDIAEMPERVTYLGRDAWQVKLLPPHHKPSILIQVTDAITGMLLEERSEQFGLLMRWVELEPGEEIADELLAWDGPFYFGYGGDDVPEDMRAMIEAGRARSDRAIKRLKRGGWPTAPAHLRLEDLDVDPDGSMHGWFSGDVHVSFTCDGEREEDDRVDRTWQDARGRTWTATGHGADAAAVNAVKDWLVERAPLLDDEPPPVADEG